MYTNELLIDGRVKLAEDINVYYNIEGIQAPFAAQKSWNDRYTLTDAIRKLLPVKQAA